ncbi:MAG: hypothetical protein KGJ32_10005 [Xanthomonadaceae bacterium]|nr:hypothetical protein [Xanthomonadaceae bacterium]
MSAHDKGAAVPMEVAQPAATAVLRHLRERTQTTPLFDVIGDSRASPSRLRVGTKLQSARSRH